MTDLGPPERHDDDFEDDDDDFAEDFPEIVWILRQAESDLEIVAGPFPAEDDTQVEAAMIGILKQDGHDPYATYALLTRCWHGGLEVSEFEEPHMDWMVSEAEVIEGEVIVDAREAARD